jgi:hypothetical protein
MGKVMQESDNSVAYVGCKEKNFSKQISSLRGQELITNARKIMKNLSYDILCGSRTKMNVKYYSAFTYSVKP